MRERLAAFVLCAALAAGGTAFAQQAPGTTDKEIRIGQTAPLSGPASAYGTMAGANAAYFAMVNDQGGVNGRRLNLIVADDMFSPAKTVEQTRKLVEQDQVLLMFNMLGTAANSSVQKYLNGRQIPQMLINSGASKFADPKTYPWTIQGLPSNRTEAKIFARYILDTGPDAKIGLLYQHDDFGKDYVDGLREGLGEAGQKRLTMLSYELSDPTVDSQILALRARGVDVVVLGALAKHTAQAIRKMGEIGWKPTTLISWAASSIPVVLTPAGLDNAAGVITTAVVKDPGDSRWAGDADFAAYKAWMAKYFPQGNPDDMANVYSFAHCYMLVWVLQNAGQDLSRENVLRQAQKIDMVPPMFLPGVKFAISPADYDPVKKFQMQRFDGKQWQFVGEPIGG